MAKSLTAWPKK